MATPKIIYETESWEEITALREEARKLRDEAAKLRGVRGMEAGAREREAAAWLLLNDHELPEDLAGLADEVVE